MENEEKARRVRSLLSAYYTTGADGGASGSRTASIDSAAFDPESYVASLVRFRALASRRAALS
jgi:hypothetical protein